MSSAVTERDIPITSSIEADFLAAYEEYADAIFRRCYFSLRDRELARDIVQETFARTWDYLSAGKRIDYLRAFLYRTAHNLVVDSVRRKRSTSLDAIVEETGFEVKDEDAADPEHSVRAQEVLARIDGLDEIYRHVVKMRYLDGLMPKDIARALGVSENVVSVRIHRGLRRLSQLVELKAGHSTA